MNLLCLHCGTISCYPSYASVSPHSVFFNVLRPFKACFCYYDIIQVILGWECSHSCPLLIKVHLTVQSGSQRVPTGMGTGRVDSAWADDVPPRPFLSPFPDQRVWIGGSGPWSITIVNRLRHGSYFFQVEGKCSWFGFLVSIADSLSSVKAGNNYVDPSCCIWTLSTIVVKLYFLFLAEKGIARRSVRITGEGEAYAKVKF